MAHDDQAIHAAAVSVGATVMGSGEAEFHYIMTAAELRRFIDALSVRQVPPCPVPIPAVRA